MLAFAHTRAILTGLADSGTAEQTAICNARIEEVDPSIRYSAYNLGPARPFPVAGFTRTA